MDLKWKVERHVLTDGKLVHLDNFSLFGLDLPFQAGIEFQNNGSEFSIGFRCDDSAFRRNEPALYDRGLILKAIYRISDPLEKEISKVATFDFCFRGNTHFGCPWLKVAELPVCKEYYLTMDIQAPADFLKNYLHNKLHDDFSKLYHAQDGADLRIYFQGGKYFPVHRLVLFSRVPAYRNSSFFSKMKDSCEKLDWTAYSKEAVNAVLKYIYSAKYSFNRPISVRLEIIALCNELGLFSMMLTQAIYISRQEKRTDIEDKQLQAVAAVFLNYDPHALTAIGQTGQLLKRRPDVAPTIAEVPPPILATSPPPILAMPAPAPAPVPAALPAPTRTWSCCC